MLTVGKPGSVIREAGNPGLGLGNPAAGPVFASFSPKRKLFAVAIRPLQELEFQFDAKHPRGESNCGTNYENDANTKSKAQSGTKYQECSPRATVRQQLRIPV